MNIHGQNKPTIAILGPGAIGGFLASLFFKNDFSVTCIAKKSLYESIKKNGIIFESKIYDNFVALPKVVTHLDFEPDILFITTKATDLSNALKRIKIDLKNTTIVPLLNGIDHIDFLRSKYNNVVAATIGNIEVKRLSSNHIIHTTTGLPFIALSNDKISQIISDIGIVAKVIPNEKELLWKKLVRLNAIACTTSATNKNIGFIRFDAFWREKLIECINESISVAYAEGVIIDANEVMEKIDKFPSTLGTSMQRDVALGKPSEIDHIACAIIRIGKKHGITCHTINIMIKMIKCQQKLR